MAGALTSVTAGARLAQFGPKTLDVDGRTVEVIASTGAGVRRVGMRPDGSYGPRIEELAVSGADLSRFAGASVLRDHRPSTDYVVGTVLMPRVEGGELRALVRFDQTPEAERLFRQVRGASVRQVSTGYNIQEWAYVGAADGDVPVFRATRWQPVELSFVAIGADAGAMVRSNPIEGRSMTTLSPEGAAPSASVPPVHTAPVVANQPPHDAEQQRATQIRSAGAALASFGVSQDVVEAAVASGASVDQARALFLDRMAAQAPTQPRPPRIEFGTDHTDPELRRGWMAAALAARYAQVEVPEAAAQYRGASVVDMARELLTLRGVRLNTYAPAVVIERALTTSDFPALLSNVANKTLRAAYLAAPSGVKQVARKTTARDFKDKTTLALGAMPALVEVGETGEYKYGSIDESKAKYRLTTYGRIVHVTRHALINDDLGAFVGLTAKFGQSSALLESRVLCDLLFGDAGAGPVMDDGKALFHADHGNLAEAGAAPSVVTLGAGRYALRQQKDDQGNPINVVARYLLTPSKLETTGEQVLTEIVANAVANVNPFPGKLELVVDPYLDTKSVTGWYLAADPAFGTLEYSYLEGEEGPQTFTQDGFETDGVKVKCRLDFGAGATDWRGLYRNPGQ